MDIGAGFSRMKSFHFKSELRMASNMESVMNGEGARRPSGACRGRLRWDDEFFEILRSPLSMDYWLRNGISQTDGRIVPKD
jgi:hypothetical protein